MGKHLKIAYDTLKPIYPKMEKKHSNLKREIVTLSDTVNSIDTSNQILERPNKMEADDGKDGTPEKVTDLQSPMVSLCSNFALYQQVIDVNAATRGYSNLHIA